MEYETHAEYKAKLREKAVERGAEAASVHGIDPESNGPLFSVIFDVAHVAAEAAYREAREYTDLVSQMDAEHRKWSVITRWVAIVLFGGLLLLVVAAVATNG